jgi:hypothetical protein
VASISWFIRFIVGIAIGISIAEFGKHISILDLDNSYPIFLLYFSSICALLIFLLCKGVFRSLDFFLFGFYLAGGLWFIFRR